jgi:hypothetical protein
MSLRSRASRPWTWAEVGGRTLAVYRSERDGRLRTALLLWQGDDPRVAVDGATPPFVAFTMDLEPDPGAGNAVTLTGFDLLEPARSHCIDWVGATTEARWDELGETAQIGVYAAIREPGFADG